MNQETKNYLIKLNYTLAPDLTTLDLVEYLVSIDIKRLMICLGGKGRSYMAAQVLSNSGIATVCLGLGIVNLARTEENEKIKIIEAINIFPTITTILDRFDEARRFSKTLERITITNTFEDYDPAVNYFKSLR